jgi:transcription antitermination factor NusG
MSTNHIVERSAMKLGTLAHPPAIAEELELEAFLRPHWYAIHTSAKHERKVAAELGRRSVESFLPLYSSVRRWKDRRVRLQMPLFPGYLFVHLALNDRVRVLQVPGVAKLVSFGGLPVALPDEQLEALRAGLRGQLRAEPHPFLTVGRRIRVLRGPFEGIEGILERKKGVLRVVVSLELILRSVAVEVVPSEVDPVFQQSRAGIDNCQDSLLSI